jgi:uncharacterized protein involved in outer membrane biogenesis
VSTDLKAPDVRPGIHLPEIHLPHIHWGRHETPPAGKGGEGPPRRRPPGLGWAIAGCVVLLVVIFLAVFDWNWLRGPIGRYASARTGRVVRLDGDLRVHLFSLTPRVDIGGLKIGNPSWGPKRNMAEIEDVAISVKLLPLLTGRVEVPLFDLERPDVALLKDAQGRANWDFSNGRKAAKPMKLPPIQTFVITQGHVRYLDQQKDVTFTGVMNANEQRSAAYDHGFHLTGDGALSKRPFHAVVTGGPLINVQPNRPYPFDAVLTAGATKVTAKGQIPKPFDLGVLDAAVSVQGRDLNELYELTGLALPNTPPYHISGRLRRDGLKYYYEGFAGTVGKSDLRGSVAVDMTSGRPLLTGKLRSRLLDFADLAGVFGAPGASKAAAPEQKAQVRAMKARGRILPDATLQTQRLRSMDARVTYAAEQVRAPNLPLRTVQLGVDLDHGLLKLDPISFNFPSGRLSGTASIDARPKVPVSKVDLRVGGVRLEQFIPAVKGARTLSGTLLARARLTGVGDSVHKAAASSDGAVTAVIPHGQIRQAFAELMGIDVTKGLFMLLSKDQTPTDIRCALADFRVKNGVLTADRIVFDTGVVRVNGEGSINLGDETLDLRFKGEPKKVRVVRAIAPITVGGRLGAPKFGLDLAPTAAQAGVGVALGALLSPLAAILPFVSPGLEKDADCAALFTEAKSSYAPVHPTTPPAPPSKGDGKGKSAKAG